MVLKFNKERCLTLLKEKKKFSQEGKLFWEYQRAKNDELLAYLSLLYEEIVWKSRKEYMKIFDLFVSKKISIYELGHKFHDVRIANRKAYEIQKKNLEAEACGILTESNEIDFQLNPKSREFTNIISSLDSSLMAFEISEDFLKLYSYLKDNFFTKINGES